MVMGNRRDTFTFIVVGRTGLGKSTFINTLLEKEIIKEKSDDINIYMLDIDCDGNKKRITAIDTPGFGKDFDDVPMHNNIINFIKLQFDKYLAEETKVKRDPNYEDTRIHCLLYFIAPNVCGMKETDIVFLKRASGLVNIVPILAKGDALTADEKRKAKANIMIQMIENDIKTIEIDMKRESNKICFKDKIPFSVICSKDRVRRYKWGIAETDNPEHCDFHILKEIMLHTHSKCLIETTDLELYENYRTAVLTKMLPNNGEEHESFNF